MSQLPPAHVAVVGQNLSAARILSFLIQKSPHLRIAWFQNETDREQGLRSRWVFSPISTGCPLEEKLSEREIHLFFGSKQRITLESFLKGAGDLHPALKRKFLGTALWNDFSPEPWRPQGDPDPTWPQREPESWALRDSFRPVLVPMHHAIPYFQKRFSDAGIHVLHDERVVLDFQKSEAKGPHLLVHNAPYEVSTANQVYCFDSKLAQEQALAAWSVQVAEVKRSHVTALPKFSVHLDTNRATRFLDCGLWESESLRRVAKIPIDDERCLLQIETLYCREEDFKKSPGRGDAFLWPLCPYLEVDDPRFSTALNHEYVFLKTLGPVLEKEKHGVTRMFLGPKTNLDELKLESSVEP